MSIVPEEVFKRRRHHFTPESIKLMIANYIVTTVGLSMFLDKGKVNWFFWVVMGFLALYNFFNIRRNREEYDKTRIIGYIVSIVVLIILFFIILLKA